MKLKFIVAMGAGLVAGLSVPGMAQPSIYAGANITGQVNLAGTVNVSQASRIAPHAMLSYRLNVAATPEHLPKIGPELRAPVLTTPTARGFAAHAALAQAAAPTQYLNVTNSSSPGFMGLTHYDERNANGGNQFSIEPPSQNLAVANGYVLEGVNNAIQVYTTTGTPLLATAISTNQLFGVPPSINRSTFIYGPSPTDMRIFYDQTMNRFIVLQRVQDNDIFQDPLPTSHIYMAVSQTGDPTGTYNIYAIDTTDANNLGCPCVSDYPAVGADQYGFYISSNEYTSNSTQFHDVSILAISKASLGSDAVAPTTVQFHVPFSTGFEFTIHPATTPPGASYFTASGGLEYFVSSQASFAFGNAIDIWAMTNTSSLSTSNPTMLLTGLSVPTLTYVTPNPMPQRPGPLTYGSTLLPPGKLAYIDGGDSRIQSVVYSGGRIYTTLATLTVDQNGAQVVGAAYVILSPVYRGTLSATVLRQGFVVVNGDNILRPAVAVTPAGAGAMVFTLLGPDYYPSAAFVPINTTSTASALQITAAGTGPEDGFTGYPDNGFPSTGTARWGDYSMAFAASDGSIWMVTEYIPNAPRTQFANWGTYITRFVP